MSITRRLFALSVVAGGLSLAAPAVALAQSAVNPAELLAAGPLGEKVLGKPDAPVTIIEYASMTCSHCATFHKDTYPRLKSEFIDTGKVRFIFREFPLDPVASAAFMLARCAPEDRYFALVDSLFATQRQWAFTNDPYNSLLAFARQAGFTQESFEACLKNQRLLDGVNAVLERGKRFGVNSTPTFFVNGKIHRGALSFDEFSKLITPLVGG